MKKPEILAPAGNIEKLKTAIYYGADAVYLSGKSYGLRRGADNFNLKMMEEGAAYAHKNNVKVYVTVNIFFHNQDLTGLSGYLKTLENLGIDGIIVSDPGVINIAKESIPSMPLHLSTQANTTNYESVLFWQTCGVRRINLARELSFKEIVEIREKSHIELEVFVHGAMCISYAGRCLISNFIVGRDSNRGECCQPCRWRYALVEESRKGEYFPIMEDESYTYFFNSKDLCLIDYIPDLIDSGIDSLKIEGRMKSAYYVGGVVRIYREAIDSYCRKMNTSRFKEKWKEELLKVSNRGYTNGFFHERPGPEAQSYKEPPYQREYDFVGITRGKKEEGTGTKVEVRKKIERGDVLEILYKGSDVKVIETNGMRDLDGNLVESANPNSTVIIEEAIDVIPGQLIRRKGWRE